jgi:hypothetical protein
VKRSFLPVKSLVTTANHWSILFAVLSNRFSSQSDCYVLLSHKIINTENMVDQAMIKLSAILIIIMFAFIAKARGEGTSFVIISVYGFLTKNKSIL